MMLALVVTFLHASAAMVAAVADPAPTPLAAADGDTSLYAPLQPMGQKQVGMSPVRDHLGKRQVIYWCPIGTPCPDLIWCTPGGPCCNGMGACPANTYCVYDPPGCCDYNKICADIPKIAIDPSGTGIPKISGTPVFSFTTPTGIRTDTGAAPPTATFKRVGMNGQKKRDLDLDSDVTFTGEWSAGIECSEGQKGKNQTLMGGSMTVEMETNVYGMAFAHSVNSEGEGSASTGLSKDDVSFMFDVESDGKGGFTQTSGPVTYSLKESDGNGNGQLQCAWTYKFEYEVESGGISHKISATYTAGLESLGNLNPTDIYNITRKRQLDIGALMSTMSVNRIRLYASKEDMDADLGSYTATLVKNPYGGNNVTVSSGTGAGSGTGAATGAGSGTSGTTGTGTKSAANPRSIAAPVLAVFVICATAFAL